MENKETIEQQEVAVEAVQDELDSIDERLLALAINGLGCAKEVFKRIKSNSEIDGDDNKAIFDAIKSIFDRQKPKPMFIDKLDLKEELKINGTYKNLDKELFNRIISTVPDRKSVHSTVDYVSRRSLKKEMDGKLERLSNSESGSVEKIAIEIAELAKRKSSNSADVLLSIDDYYGEIDHIEEMPECVSTGFPTLDKRLGGGYVKGNYHVICAATGAGKALSLDTLIPTPDGNTTIKDINIGDSLFNENGEICHVTNKSEIFYKDCYQIIFDTGEKVIASEDHLWTVLNINDKRKIANSETPVDWRNYWDKTSTLTTLELFNKKEVKSGRSNFAIPISKPIDGNKYDGSVEPYLLGYWLGDGSSYSSTITVHKDDSEEFITNIDTKRKVTINKSSNKNTNMYFISNLKPDMLKEFSFKLTGKYNKIIKRIPSKILRADFDTRLEVLKGLMDSDGYVVTNTNSVEITLKKSDLCEDVFELITSLGFKCYKTDKEFIYNDKPYLATRMTFRPNINVFKLKRKADKICYKCGQPSRHTARMIKDIIKVDNVPTQCIMVDSARNLFCITNSFIPTHNSIMTITSWLSQVRNGVKTVYLNYEIPRSLFMKYLFAQVTGLNVMHSGSIERDLLEYKKEMFRNEIDRYFDEGLLMLSDPMHGSSKMWNDVEVILRDIIEQSNPECIFFDTINSVYAKTSSSSQGARWNEYEYIAISAEHLTTETNVAMVFTAQPSQEAMKREDRTPQLYDVAGGKTITEKAASVIHLHRTDLYDPNRRIDYSELHITKNRVMGQEMGSLPIRVKYNKDYKNLYELEQGVQGLPLEEFSSDLPSHPIYSLSGEL